MVSDFSTVGPRGRRRFWKKAREAPVEGEKSSSRVHLRRSCCCCRSRLPPRSPEVFFFIIFFRKLPPAATGESGAHKDVEGSWSHPADSQSALHAALTLDQPRSPGFAGGGAQSRFYCPPPHSCVPPPPSPSNGQQLKPKAAGCTQCPVLPGRTSLIPFYPSGRLSTRKRLQSPVNPLPAPACLPVCPPEPLLPSLLGEAGKFTRKLRFSPFCRRETPVTFSEAT